MSLPGRCCGGKVINKTTPKAEFRTNTPDYTFAVVFKNVVHWHNLLSWCLMPCARTLHGNRDWQSFTRISENSPGTTFWSIWGHWKSHLACPWGLPLPESPSWLVSSQFAAPPNEFPGGFQVMRDEFELPQSIFWRFCDVPIHSNHPWSEEIHNSNQRRLRQFCCIDKLRSTWDRSLHFQRQIIRFLVKSVLSE